MRLRLAISPCPNDTFMFDALINGRIDTHSLDFEVSFADIEQLNDRVLEKSSGSTKNRTDISTAHDISKISYAVLPEITDRYVLLDSGSALGHGNGPLLIARPDFKIPELSPYAPTDNAVNEIPPASGMYFRTCEKPAQPANPAPKVAIPGIHTTANLLLRRLFPGPTDRRPMLFSEIAPAVANGEYDAGVLIHEGRFTYREHGLELVADLGLEWERSTGLPLPLGAIVASRRLPQEVIKVVEELIRESIEYAFAHPGESRAFVKSHAREMDDKVIDNHIALFVNHNSLSLSPDARLAIETLTGVEIK